MNIDSIEDAGIKALADQMIHNEEIKKIECKIPFAGFYETIHSDRIDWATESDYEYAAQELSEIFESMDIDDDSMLEGYCDWLLSTADVDYKEMQQDYCRFYADDFWEEMQLHLNAIGILSMTFVENVSPREYNFHNDVLTVSCDVEIKTINNQIRGLLESESWAKYLKDNFTSYSGFHSYYSNTPQEFHNENMENGVPSYMYLSSIIDFLTQQEASENIGYAGEDWTGNNSWWDFCKNPEECSLKNFLKEKNVQIRKKKIQSGAEQLHI